MQVIDHISFLDIKDKKVLIVRSKGKDIWWLPGGKREINETDEQVLIRECAEEISIQIIPNSIELFDVLKGKAYGKTEETLVEVKVFTADFTGKIVPSSEIEEARYSKFNDIPLSSPTGMSFFQSLVEKNLLQ